MRSSTRLFILFAIALSSIVRDVHADADFTWDSLTPSDKLNWTPCYSAPLECTRLLVPLDYESSAVGNASIAITRYPSSNSSGASAYLGPVLVNPGGPGGSGVDYVVEAGQQIATILGDGFDIIGFDPRGVSYSRPAISWFNSDAERAFWIPPTQSTVYNSLNESAYAVAQGWARAQIEGQLAEERAGDYVQYMTTDNTARDMLRITEALGEEKLKYWGISYGSVLGATFATLFPDKVGRVVIDGVLDMEAWYSANLTNQMLDIEKGLQIFADACFAAGPTDCAFHAPSSAEISANLQRLLDASKTNPVPVVTPISYTVFGYTLLKNAIFDSLTSGSSFFGVLAEGLADLAKGDASTIYTAFVEVPPFDCAVDSDANSTIPFHENGYEASVSIACGDGAAVTDTVGELQEFYEAGQKVSSFADLVLTTRVGCSGWKVHRKDRFAGPVGAAHTSFPLLVIGNTADPVAPIAGANKTANAFPGSVMLTLDAVAHTSTGALSTCVFGYLRQYFVNGTLPDAGTACTPDDPLFPSTAANSTTSTRRNLRSNLLEAGRAIGRAQRRSASRNSRVKN
ncbi:Alpha/Beta hydrolase protein [Mycena filopes]|nr:Alpha/Beta hydrolase protein [Mycena filopes]